ncbi:hypothetical protein QE152_g8471 [Popillia japonica]|uniref:Uncharacterized protein n=1 Tax=Popillia japonica TaxID=7064 RepID=A0AAW1M2T5_POPJA
MLLDSTLKTDSHLDYFPENLGASLETICDAYKRFSAYSAPLDKRISVLKKLDTNQEECVYVKKKINGLHCKD